MDVFVIVYRAAILNQLLSNGTVFDNGLEVVLLRREGPS